MKMNKKVKNITIFSTVLIYLGLCGTIFVLEKTGQLAPFFEQKSTTNKIEEKIQPIKVVPSINSPKTLTK